MDWKRSQGTKNGAMRNIFICMYAYFHFILSPKSPPSVSMEVHPKNIPTGKFLLSFFTPQVYVRNIFFMKYKHIKKIWATQRNAQMNPFQFRWNKFRTFKYIDNTFRNEKESLLYNVMIKFNEIKLVQTEVLIFHVSIRYKNQRKNKKLPRRVDNEFE